MKLNGKQVVLAQSVTLLEFLEREGYRPALVAVERNGEIVPRSQFPSTVLMEEDEVEIVSFVGGG